MKILNLYAGIGGNRKLWGDKHEVTAIEINPEIARIYKDFFPKDQVIVTDAHKFLLNHFDQFDFIWSSPPCPSHSRMQFLMNEQEGKKNKFPDMKLYEEIIFLKHWFKGKWVVENVISYYNPLIKPHKVGNHYYWSNFFIDEFKEEKRNLIRMSVEEKIKEKEKKFKIDLKVFEINNQLKVKVLDNCVEPKTALHIFKMAFKDKQTLLNSH